MYIDFFERHLAVGSRDEAVRMTKTDKHFWNVISICSPTTRPVELREAKRVFVLRFDDTEDPHDSAVACAPNAESITAAIKFARETAPGGLLVHCQMGLSRSPAIALVLLAHKLWPAPDALDQACTTLLDVRPISRPNNLIIKLGFGLFLPAEVISNWTARVSAHPQFLANRLATADQPRE